MLVAIALAVLAQAPQGSPTKSVVQIMEAHDRALVRDLDEYVKQSPKADDIGQAYFTIFDRVLDHDWYAEFEPIARRYLTEKPEGASRPVARLVIVMGRTRAGKFAEGLGEFQKMLQEFDPNDESAFATTVAQRLVLAAIAGAEDRKSVV